MVVIKVGPIESVQCVFDKRRKFKNYAWVVFRHSSSVEDSIKLFCKTKLYGIQIKIKKCTKYMYDVLNTDFVEGLNYFTQLVDAEHKSQPKEINKKRFINHQNSVKINVPKSLSDIHSAYSSMQCNYSSSTQSLNNKLSMYKQHNSPYTYNSK